MNKLLRSLKNSARQITIIAFFSAAALILVSGIGDFGNGFMPVLGSFLNTLIIAGLLALYPVLLLIKKDEYLKPVSLIVVGYFFISLTSTYLSATAEISSFAPAYYNVINVFVFIAALGLITAFVFYLIALLDKNKHFNKLTAYVLLCICCFTALIFILDVIAIIIYGGALGLFYDLAIYVCIPLAVTFTVFPHLVGEIPEAEKTSEHEAETVSDVKAEDPAFAENDPDDEAENASANNDEPTPEPAETEAETQTKTAE